MLAELLLTICAGETAVCFLSKALRMSFQRDLPANEQQQRKTEQTPCIESGNKQERREHHCVIPVIDPAGRAAAIAHHPCLKRAEKQNTDHIADCIRHTDQQKNPLIDPSRQIRRADCTVQKQPGYNHCFYGCKSMIITNRFPRRFVIA